MSLSPHDTEHMGRREAAHILRVADEVRQIANGAARQIVDLIDEAGALDRTSHVMGSTRPEIEQWAVEAFDGTVRDLIDTDILHAANTSYEMGWEE